MTHRLTISFRLDPIDPTSPAIEIGSLILNGDSFVRFTYSIDIESDACPWDDLTRGLLQQVPNTLQATIRSWPNYRNRSVPQDQKETDPISLIAYLEQILRYSSFFVSEVSDIH